MSDYVQLKNLQGQPLKPVTDLAAINMTTTNGIQVVPANGGTIGITSGYINSAYYVDMVSEDVGPASTSSAYIEGGTATLITGAYTVTSAVNSSTPSQQKIPSEAAVVSALNNVVTSGTSYYAGTGIAIDAGHTVSVSGVPTSAVAGLDTQLTNINAAVAAKQDAISAGYRMSLDGTTLNQQRYFPVKDTGTSATITLEAGSAYKIQATTGSKTLTAETVSAGMFGLEGHAEIFIAGAGLIKTTSNVILAQPLEPDSVNNCTVRFHDGYAIISVEDHIAGYIVMVNATSGSGSLNYALGVSTEYISVDASLNGQTLDLAGAVTNGEKHVVGNGYTETIISGGINCTSKTTLSNLAADGVIVSSGTLTLGDVFIPSGSTVSIGVGTLALERVTGDGGVIDLSGSTQWIKNTYEQDAFISGVTITNGDYSTTPSTHFGALNASYGNTTATDVTITNCSGGQNPVGKAQTGILTLSGCSVVNNSGELRVNSGGTLVLEGGNVFENTIGFRPGSAGAISATPKVVFKGSNTLKATITPYSKDNTGIVEITSGAIVDLTGNTNATPIAPGRGIVFGSNVQIYPSAGSASAVEITGGTFMQITNGGVVVGGGCSNNEIVDGHNTATLNPSASAFALRFSATLQNFNVIGEGQVAIRNGATVKDCNLQCRASLVSSGYSGILAGTVRTNNLINTAANSYGTFVIADGAVVDFTGNPNTTPINPTGTNATSSGAVIVEDGGCQVITSSGSTVSIAGGTYTKINNDGTTE